MTNSIVITLSLISLLITASLIIFMVVTGQYKLIKSGRYFIWLLLCASIWTLFYIFKCMSSDSFIKLIMIKLQHLGVVGVLVSFVSMTSESYLNYRFRKNAWAVSFILCALYLLFVWINPWGLYYKAVEPIYIGQPNQSLYVTYGPVFFIFETFALLAVLISAAAIIIKMRKAKVLQVQVSLVLTAISLPFLAALCSVFRITSFDLTCPSFAMSGILIYICSSHYGVFDSLPYIKRHFIDIMDRATFVLQDDDTVVYINQIAESLIGKKMEDCKGNDLYSLIPGLTKEAVSKKNFRQTISFPCRPPVELSFKIVDLYSKRGKFMVHVVTVRDITEFKRMEDKLGYLQEYDEATGFYSETKWMEILSQFEQQHDTGLERTVITGISIRNLNRLSVVLSQDNIADLAALASDHIRKCQRSNDAIARFGENEFYVFSNGAYYVSSLFKSRLEEASKSQTVINRQKVNLEYRIGYYVIESGVDAKTALENVAFALKSALASETESVMAYDKAMKKQHNIYKCLLGMAEDISHCMDLSITYQPIFDLKRRKVAGAESFIDLNHPAIGKISPDIFIPVFENTGYIMQLELKMLEQVFKTFKSWQCQLPEDFYLSINISKQEIYEDGFIPKLKELLHANDVDPTRLVFELKALYPWDDWPGMIQFSQSIRSLGIRLAADCFVWHKSSFAHIVDLNCAILKIEPSFMDDVYTNSNKSMTVQTLFSLCRNVNVDIVAENMESLLEFKTFQKYGVELMQGSLFGQALPAQEFFNCFDTMFPEGL